MIIHYNVDFVIKKRLKILTWNEGILLMHYLEKEELTVQVLFL